MSAHKKRGKSLVRRLHEKAGAPPHAVAHHRRGIALQFARFRAAGLGGFAAFGAVLGPGVLAGLSDDDPAGITTYSILGADYGYRLLWVLLLSTVALVVFHELGARMGVVTGKGLTALIRERYSPSAGVTAAVVLIVANI